MLTYLLKRFSTAIPTMLILIVLSFLLIHAAPGNCFEGEKNLAPEILAEMRKAFHLDLPIYQQLGLYLGNLFTGDLGISCKYKGTTVAELIGAGFPVSLTLGVLAMLLALTVGGALGMVAALRQNTGTDYSLMTLAMLGISIPSFAIAPLLVLGFAVHWGWLPAGGWKDGTVKDMILPVVALALPQIAYVARLMRGSMIETLRQNFIRTARAKGLPERIVLLRHALRPAMMPVLSYVGPATAGIVTGSVVIEQIFGIPGVGRYFVQAALNRDDTLMLGIVIFYGALIISANLLVDVLYGWLDPRVRLNG